MVPGFGSHLQIFNAVWDPYSSFSNAQFPVLGARFNELLATHMVIRIAHLIIITAWSGTSRQNYDYFP